MRQCRVWIYSKCLLSVNCDHYSNFDSHKICIQIKLNTIHLFSEYLLIAYHVPLCCILRHQQEKRQKIPAFKQEYITNK